MPLPPADASKATVLQTYPEALRFQVYQGYSNPEAQPPNRSHFTIGEWPGLNAQQFTDWRPATVLTAPPEVRRSRVVLFPLPKVDEEIIALGLLLTYDRTGSLDQYFAHIEFNPHIVEGFARKNIHLLLTMACSTVAPGNTVTLTLEANVLEGSDVRRLITGEDLKLVNDARKIFKRLAARDLLTPTLSRNSKRYRGFFLNIDNGQQAAGVTALRAHLDVLSES